MRQRIFYLLFLFISVQVTAQDIYDAKMTTSDIGLPTTIHTGKTAQVNISMQNIGKNAWLSGEVAMHVKVVSGPSGSSGQYDELTTDGTSIKLDRTEVLVRGNAFCHYTIEGPAAEGLYALEFQLVRNGKLFGPRVQKTIQVINDARINRCTWAATISTANVKMPQKMMSGNKQHVVVEVDNTGTCEWLSARNKVEMKVTCISWPDIGSGEKEKLTPQGSDNYLIAEETYEIEAHKQATFEYDIVGPSAPGTYKVEFQMTNERKPFGPHFTREITIVGDPKRCDIDGDITVSGVPTTTEYKEDYQVTVRATNHGICDWTADTKIEVRAKLIRKPSGVASTLPDVIPEESWELGSRVIRPGAYFEFKYTMYGPYVLGAYTVQWEIYARGATTSKLIAKTFTSIVPK